MGTTKRRYPKEEIARRGEEIFEKQVRPSLKGASARHFIAIDIETGEYEIDESEMAACARLRSRVPEAQIWLRRVGSRSARRFGGRRSPVA
ncbi:MAG: hypothetical protein FJ303_16815 [Planctomycetes bacterium]|nr:hypothetical protein [Planctomycetota bacterium]